MHFRQVRFWAAAALAVAVLGTLLVEPALAQKNDPQYRHQIRTAKRELLRNNGRYAAELYERILEKYPEDEEACRGYAESLIQQEKVSEAESFLDEKISVVQPRINLLRTRVQVYQLQERREAAFKDALEILAENDGLASWVFDVTRELIRDGLDPAEARQDAESALERFPDHLSFSVLTAVITALDGRFDEALTLITERDERKRQHGQGIRRYADELLALGYREHALEALLWAADKSQKSSRRTQILFSAADLLEDDERFEEALVQLDRVAAEREGTSAAGKALIRSAEIHQKHLDDPRGALAVYEKLENDPSLGHYRPEMLLQMGNCYVRLGNFGRAAEVFRNVLPEALDPEHAETAAYRMAEVEFYRGDADSALVLYQEMAENNPRSLLTDEAAGRYILLNTYVSLGGGEALSLLGRMQWALSVGDSSQVDSTARVLIGRYPGGELSAEAWLALAAVAEEGGSPELAIEHLDKVVKRHADDRRAAIALRRQGDLFLYRLGNREEALARYEQILTDHPESVLEGEVRRQVQELRQSL